MGTVLPVDVEEGGDVVEVMMVLVVVGVVGDGTRVVMVEYEVVIVRVVRDEDEVLIVRVVSVVPVGVEIVRVVVVPPPPPDPVPPVTVPDP